MKIYLLIILTTITSLTIRSQDIEGTYANKWVSTSGEGVVYKLMLHKDGSFIFHATRIYMDPKRDTKATAQGTWCMDGQLLVLSTNDSIEADSKIASGLHLNKARFESLSPRHPDFEMVKPSLKFFKSDVFYAKDMALIKTSNSVSAVEAN